MSDLPSTIRVLVAEDNPLERSTLVDLLGALGHMVVAEVASGTEAIEKAHASVAALGSLSAANATPAAADSLDAPTVAA